MNNAPQSLELVVFAPGDEASLYPLPVTGKVILGRAEDTDIRIEDPSVSRRHAALHLHPLHIEDLGSSNGTYVRRREERASSVDTRKALRKPGETFQVELGDCIVLGSVVATVRKCRSTSRGSDPVALAPASEPVVVQDLEMQQLYEQARQAARSDMSILILGETGVGKEVLARAIHEASPRAKGPFVAIHCAALSESLLESELFGHKKGSFTGASEDKPGLFEAAHGGTLFLDEIGELSAAVQVKLLRALDERAVLRVGERAPRRIDVRFIAATNRDLEAERERGRFRGDLFYRLAGTEITVPPLRARVSEIVPLARLFLQQECRKLERTSIPEFSDEVTQLLEEYTWPGNVREVRNAMQRASVLCTGREVLVEHLPPRISGHLTVIPSARGSSPDLRAVSLSAQQATLNIPAPDMQLEHKELSEWRRIVEVLEQCAGNQTRAAEMLGISRRTLVSRLEKYGIARPRKR